MLRGGGLKIQKNCFTTKPLPSQFARTLDFACGYGPVGEGSPPQHVLKQRQGMSFLHIKYDIHFANLSGAAYYYYLFLFF